MENRQNLFNAWYELARTMTPETLGALGKTLRSSVQDSQDLIHATVAVIDAAAYAMVKDLNVGQEFMYLLSVLAFRHINNMGDGFTTILNYDDMLDPSKRQNFEKVMPEHVFADLQEKAHTLLSSGEKLHPAQQKHLENIVKGRVPFGYTILEEDLVTDPQNYEVRPSEQPEEVLDEIVEDGTVMDNMMVEPEVESTVYDEVYNHFDGFEEDDDIQVAEEDYEPDYIVDEEPMEPEFIEDEYDNEVMGELPMFDEYIDTDYDVDEYHVEEIEEEKPVTRRAIKRINVPEPEIQVQEEPEQDHGMSLAEAISRLNMTRSQLE